MNKTNSVIEQAKKHGGIITTAEALSIGMSSSTIARRVEDGIFARLKRGLLALPGASTRPDALLRAAGRILGAVTSHYSAAALHGMSPLPKEYPPTVTVHHRGTHTFPGLVVRQSTDLRPEHTIVHQGITITSAPRTILDLAAVARPRRLETILDQSLVTGSVHLDDLITFHESISRQGKKGMKGLRRMLLERSERDRIPESVLETRMVSLLTRGGLALPVTQFTAPWLEPIDGRVDFAYVDRRILIEADSRRWHGTFQAFETDRRRDMAAQLAGWIVLRFTWNMITNDPAYVIQTVRETLELRNDIARAAFSR